MLCPLAVSGSTHDSKKEIRNKLNVASWSFMETSLRGNNLRDKYLYHEAISIRSKRIEPLGGYPYRYLEPSPMPFVSQSRALDPVHLPKRDRPLLTRPRRLATCAAGADPHDFRVVRGFMRMLKHAAKLNKHYRVLRRSDSMHVPNLGFPIRQR